MHTSLSNTTRRQTAQQSIIEDVMRQILDGVSLVEFLKNYGVHSEHAPVIRQIGSILSHSHRRLILRFYELHHHDPKVLAYFRNSEQMDQVMQKSEEYIIASFSWPIDRDYIHRALRVGLAHYRIDLPPMLYQSAFSWLGETLMRILRETLIDEKELGQCLQVANTILCFQRFITLESFHIYERMEVNRLRKKEAQLLRTLLHDISNPISAVTSKIELMLCDHNVSSKDLQTLSEQCRRITNAVKNMRQQSLPATGDRILNNHAMSISDIFSQIRLLFSKAFATAGQCLVLLPPEQEIRVVADPNTLIYHVLHNILENCLRFSLPEKTTRITIDASSEWVTLEICDQGIGIPDDLLEGIFFGNPEAVRIGCDGTKGQGYGLTVAKAYTEMMNGRIRITRQNEPDTSTCVEVVLPRYSGPPIHQWKQPIETAE